MQARTVMVQRVRPNMMRYFRTNLIVKPARGPMLARDGGEGQPVAEDAEDEAEGEVGDDEGGLEEARLRVADAPKVALDLRLDAWGRLPSCWGMGTGW